MAAKANNDSEKNLKKKTTKSTTLEAKKKTTKSPTKKTSSTPEPKSKGTIKAKAVKTKSDGKASVKPLKKVIDPRTGQVIVTGSKASTKKVDTPSVTPVKEEAPIKKRTALPKKSSKELTIETPRKEKSPIVRPTPKKVKELNKDEKVLYKQLEEAFTFVANMTLVIEERTMDKKLISDLTIGELHVIETVNKNNNKPMTLIAKREHVTVGALTICVNRLVQKGYLLRTRDEMDHRVILLSVTQKAKKILKSHDKFHDDILGLVLENVNLGMAQKVMSMFAQTLEYYYDPSTIQEKPLKKGKK